MTKVKTIQNDLIKSKLAPRNYIPNSQGRPTKYSEELKKDFCNLLKEGHGRTYACKKVGINFSTFMSWFGMNTAQYTHLKKQEFIDAVLEAEKEKLQKIEDDMIYLIIKAAQESKNWTAAAWVLERTFPEKYSLRRSDFSLQNTNFIINFKQKSEYAEILAESSNENENTEDSTKQQNITNTSEITLNNKELT